MAAVKLTERDTLAWEFIQIAMHCGEQQVDPVKLVRRGYEFADAMLKERAQSAAGAK